MSGGTDHISDVNHGYPSNLSPVSISLHFPFTYHRSNGDMTMVPNCQQLIGPSRLVLKSRTRLSTYSERFFHSSKWAASKVIWRLARYMAQRQIGPERTRVLPLLRTNEKAIQTLRWYSPMYDKDVEDRDGGETVLYERNSHRLALTRSAFGIACFHSCVWIGYNAYFFPMFEHSDLIVNSFSFFPAFGYTIAAIVQIIATGYPIRLVSRLVWKRNHRQLLLYRYTFPFIRENPEPVVFELGQIVINPLSTEAATILNDLQGDISKFEGHISLQQTRQSFFSLPYLLDISESVDVREPQMLFDSLLQPERIRRETYRSVSSGRTEKRTGRRKSR